MDIAAIVKMKSTTLMTGEGADLFLKNSYIFAMFMRSFDSLLTVQPRSVMLDKLIAPNNPTHLLLLHWY